ncbi:hypothetical protein BDK51DRAFT_43249 [Blyttiomyces helicus]|uniref:Uncharacterized protein n=1 Tax=Blyttiomyces helicus TaxID=388810 RepID=A0A4P9WNS0_9FUNG|nr:hypothetical protein BDK51DRAFT_43249 [Blyttiomyces helicus]|eukprot:RKO93935.1 hypothetical protein BDK51DRAFT_43249 [Blyttiomyces helicus]
MGNRHSPIASTNADASIKSSLLLTPPNPTTDRSVHALACSFSSCSPKCGQQWDKNIINTEGVKGGKGPAGRGGVYSPDWESNRNYTAKLEERLAEANAQLACLQLSRSPDTLPSMVPHAASYTSPAATYIMPASPYTAPAATLHYPLTEVDLATVVRAFSRIAQTAHGNTNRAANEICKSHYNAVKDYNGTRNSTVFVAFTKCMDALASSLTVISAAGQIKATSCRPSLPAPQAKRCSCAATSTWSTPSMQHSEWCNPKQIHGAACASRVGVAPIVGVFVVAPVVHNAAPVNNVKLINQCLYPAFVEATCGYQVTVRSPIKTWDRTSLPSSPLQHQPHPPLHRYPIPDCPVEKFCTSVALTAYAVYSTEPLHT